MSDTPDAPDIPRTQHAWRIDWHGYDAGRQGLREALTTLANGYLGTRGALAEAAADGTHYPGCYPAGCYDRLTSAVAGRSVEIEDLVNAPNWLPVQVRADGGAWLHPDRADMKEHRLSLDLETGTLHRHSVIRDAEGRETRIAERRVVHVTRPHLMALELTVTPLNWGGHIEVRSALDGRVENAGVARYRAFDGRHLRARAQRADARGLHLRVETAQSGIGIALSARTRLALDGRTVDLDPDVETAEGYCAQVFATTIAEGASLSVAKTVALFTSRDPAISEAGAAADKAIARAPEAAELFDGHATAWRHRWRRYALEVSEKAGSNDSRTVRLLRLHLFHLLQTVPARDHFATASVPARGLHGEAYHGHVFWDELFVLPVLTLREPEVSRGLLAYRHERLEEARAAARAAGYRGAMFPWQSGSDGREETQALHLNPRSQRWLPDHSALQRHVSTAVAYNMWQFYLASGDPDFAVYHAAEVILEVARFWASAATYNAGRERYDIAGVMGPDEYHDAYPGADRPGLANNAYTNVMATWVLSRAFELLQLLPPDHAAELRDRLEIDDAELARWDDVSRRLHVPFHDGDIISQFEGYADLAELDWDGYRARYDDIQRLDRILEAEGDTPNRYKASKQADVLMLFYLLSSEELTRLFQRLGYAFDPASIPRNIDYYLARTSHGSTLSRVVHAWVLARRDRPRSWRMFRDALDSDICDIQGGTTAEGIHLGAMAGTVDLVQRCYTGLELCGDVLRFSPALPDELTRLAFRMRYRGQGLRVSLERDGLSLEVGRDVPHALEVMVDGTRATLAPGESRTFRW